ncbi:hypothetical protein [Acinetobacter terrae]|nr:hypothetical protein [Acinetobacter terrae]
MSLVAGVLMVLFSMALALQMICSLDEEYRHDPWTIVADIA